MVTIRTRTWDGTLTTITQLVVRIVKLCEQMFSYLTPSLFFFLAAYNAGSSNFGWNLGAPNALASMPMPQPPSPSPRYDARVQDNTDPGVEETFAAKEAGAMSFAHYIVKWVSFTIIVFFPVIHVQLNTPLSVDSSH